MQASYIHHAQAKLHSSPPDHAQRPGRQSIRGDGAAHAGPEAALVRTEAAREWDSHLLVQRGWLRHLRLTQLW